MDYKFLFLVKDNKLKKTYDLLVQIHKIVLICTVGKMTLFTERKYCVRYTFVAVYL